MQRDHYLVENTAQGRSQSAEVARVQFRSDQLCHDDLRCFNGQKHRIRFSPPEFCFTGNQRPEQLQTILDITVITRHSRTQPVSGKQIKIRSTVIFTGCENEDLRPGIRLFQQEAHPFRSRGRFSAAGLSAEQDPCMRIRSDQVFLLLR